MWVDVITGFVLSVTSTLKVTSSVLPASSVTVSVTVFVAPEIDVPATGFCVTSRFVSQLSVAVTSPV